MNDRDKAIDRAADHIRRQCQPSDMGGRMVLAAFAMDSINQQYPKETDGTERKETGN